MNTTPLFCLLLFPLLAIGQVRIEVVRHPPFITSDSSLYMASSLNGWGPCDEKYKMTRSPGGVYFITLPDTVKNFRYKFTQGAWSLVEGDSTGRSCGDREYNRAALAAPNLVQVEIAGWERQPVFVLIANKIPEETPAHAVLYVMGNFNNWNPGDQTYKLHKQIDGTWRVLIYTPLPEIQFKFTRGTLQTTESKPGGRMMFNRVAKRQEVALKPDLFFEIDGWSDIQGGFNMYSLHDLLLLFSVFQGILLLITLPRIQQYNTSANNWLLLLIGFSSAILLIRVLSNVPSIADVFPKLKIVPDLIFFIYAPLFYFYIERLLFHLGRVLYVRLHFIPAIVQLLIYMVYFFMSEREFSEKIALESSDLNVIRFALSCAAVFTNIYYWQLSRRAIYNYRVNFEYSHSFEQNLQFLNSVVFIQAICIFSWAGVSAYSLLSKIYGWHLSYFYEFGFETVWAVFSMITFFLGYFAIQEPDVFKAVPEMATDNLLNGNLLDQMAGQLQSQAVGRQKEEVADIEAEVKRVSKYMSESKPFTNPKLTLLELARLLDMPPYLLSKVINSGFEKNFFDFINYYRIEEFKSRINDPQFQHYTLLSIAFDVGFNSKTAFNRSFKKITNQTPSAFYQKAALSEEFEEGKVLPLSSLKKMGDKGK